jgi:hypothetical protein
VKVKNVRRPDAAELLKIRRGELNLDELIRANKGIEDMDALINQISPIR